MTVTDTRQRLLLTAGGVATLLVVWGLTSIVWPNSAPVGIVLQGVVFGTVTGLMAVGLVLIYKTNNIINFAYGGMGGVGGVLAVHLFLEAGTNYFLAIALGLLTGLAVGGLVEVLVVRRFATSSRLILTVATIGLAQILGGIELIIPRLFGATGFVGGFETPLTFRVSIEPVVFTADHLLIVACVPPIITGLLWFLLRTDVGIAVRAAADNNERALLYGIPTRRLSTIVWVVAGGLAAFTFILKAPFAGSVSTAFGGVTTLLLPALAASIVARMESLPLAFGAGVGLGIVEQLVFWNTGRASTIDVAFFVVILVALLLQRGRMARAFEGGGTWSMTGLTRAVPEELRRLPEVWVGRAVLLATIVLLALLLPLGMGPGTVNLMSFAVVWGMVGLSLVILTGWGGNISLGQFAIVGAGAIVFGNIAVRWNLDMFLTLLVAGAAGGLVALLVGLPALRIRGLFLAATTLAFAVVFDSFFLNPVMFPNHIPGSVNRPVLWERFDLHSEWAMYYVCLFFLGITILVARGVRAARGGRVLLATRDNYRAAGAAAVPTTAAKLSGFVLSGIVAGVAGGLNILLLRGARAGSFQPSMSLEVFSTAVIGGLGSIAGALLGVFTFRFLRQVLSGELRLLVTGTGLLVVLLVLPGGLGQALMGIRDRFLRLVADRRGIIVPSLVADRAVREPEEHDADGTGLLVGALTGDVRPVPDGNGRPADDTAPVGTPSLESALLRCDGLDVSYGPVQVLFGVDFEVAEGEIVALLGTNGAGKSTLLKSISGLLEPGAGRIELDGRDITGRAPEVNAADGILQMPGGRSVFATLTVEENLRLAAWLFRDDRDRYEAVREEVLELFPPVRRRYHELAGNLSGGEQQMLSLAGVLMNRPRLLMIDELSLGLAPTVVGELVDVVHRTHEETGTTIVVVEQSVNVALTLASRAVFMEKGEVRFAGPTAELLERPDILRSVFIAGASAAKPDGDRRRARGRRSRKPPAAVLAELDRTPPPADAPVVLECIDVVKCFGGVRAVDESSLEVRDGQILGLIGQNGAGKTTLFDCVSGFLPLDGGRVLLQGRDITELPPHERATAGLGRSFQEARLYPTLTVAETIAVALERHLTTRNMLAAALQLPASYETELAAHERVEELIDLMGLGAFREKFVGELSTGSRRIVELACVLAQDPSVLLLDEPSAGIAQRETEALGPLLLRVQQHTGCTLLVIEHDMPLLRSICDEMAAMELGRVIVRGPPQHVLEHPRVIESYLGSEEAVIERSGSRSAARGSKEGASAR